MSIFTSFILIINNLDRDIGIILVIISHIYICFHILFNITVD